MKIDAREIKSAKTWQADVCVMGGGVAGITLANELSQQGISVILLEAGGENYDANVQDVATANKVSYPYPNPNQSRLRMLGGTSNHWSNNTSPLSPIDFEKREGINNTGWPMTYKEIEPYYKKAAAYCRTGEDGYDLSHWHKVFDIKSTLPGDHKTSLRLGVAKASIPPTQFYRAHGGDLLARDNVTIISYAQVVDIDFDENSETVNGVGFVVNGTKNRVEAKEFVMAFGGIENARMLLYFNQKHNNKLGNQGDSVGRYFMDHPTLKAAQLYTVDPSKFTMFEGELASDYQRFIVNFFELSEERLRALGLTNIRMPLTKATRQQMSHGVSSFHLLRETLSGKALSGSLASHITNLVMDAGTVLDAVSRKALDKTLIEGSGDFAGYEVNLMMEQTPHRDNRITLSDKVDAFGIPKIDIEWKIHEADKDRLWRGLDVFSSEIGALGLGRVRSLKERSARLFTDQVGFGHHHMGATRMSETPATGAVNKEQKVFGTNNFSIAGCSVFATGGHVPPTLTIAATSIRLADIIKKRIRG